MPESEFTICEYHFSWASFFKSLDTIKLDFGEGLMLGTKEYDGLYKITMILQIATKRF